jgi:tetratricopeptide (TPR) repeat protein
MLDTVCTGSEPGEPGYVITHPRLFRRHPQLHWRGRVHEQLVPCPSTLGYEICYSKIRIEHLGYCDMVVYQRKLLRDARLLRMDHAVDPSDPSTLLHLGQAYMNLGKPAEARKYLQQLLSLEKRPVDYLRRVFVTLATLSLREGKFTEAAQITQQALQNFPGDDHLSFVQAEALYELDAFVAAAQTLIEIINRPEISAYRAGTPEAIKTLLAPRCLSEVLRMQRRFDAAEAVLLPVLEAYPQNVGALHALGRVYIDQRRADKVREVAQRLRECPGGISFARLLMAAWHYVRGEFGPAEAFLDELIGQEPNMAAARLMRAECLTRRSAPRAERCQAYRDVLRIEPANGTAVSRLRDLEAEELCPAGVTPAVVGSQSYVAMA